MNGGGCGSTISGAHDEDRTPPSMTTFGGRLCHQGWTAGAGLSSTTGTTGTNIALVVDLRRRATLPLSSTTSAGGFSKA